MKLKQLLSMSLAALLVMSSVPVPALAASWDGTEFLVVSSDDFSADEAAGETAVSTIFTEDASTGETVIEPETDGYMLPEVSAADITDEPASQEAAADTYGETTEDESGSDAFDESVSQEDESDTAEAAAVELPGAETGETDSLFEGNSEEPDTDAGAGSLQGDDSGFATDSDQVEEEVSEDTSSSYSDDSAAPGDFQDTEPDSFIEGSTDESFENTSEDQVSDDLPDEVPASEGEDLNPAEDSTAAKAEAEVIDEESFIEETSEEKLNDEDSMEERFSQAELLEPGVPLNAEFSYEVSEVYYHICPPEDGLYAIYSSGVENLEKINGIAYVGAYFYEPDPDGSEGEYIDYFDSDCGGNGNFKFIKELEAGIDYYLSIYPSGFDEVSIGIHLEKLADKGLNRLKSVYVNPNKCVLNPDKYNTCRLYIDTEYETTNNYDREQYNIQSTDPSSLTVDDNGNDTYLVTVLPGAEDYNDLRIIIYTGTMGEPDYYEWSSISVKVPEEPVYKVTYDLNGGVWIYDSYEIETDGDVGTSGTVINLPGSYKINKRCHEFLGWSETPDGESVFTGNYTITDDVTLYAIWEEDPNLITFDLQGGDWFSDYDRGVFANGVAGDTGDQIGWELPDETDVIRDGFHFIGWTLEPGAEDIVDSTLEYGGKKTLYAKWLQNASAFYHLEGGEWVGDFAEKYGNGQLSNWDSDEDIGEILLPFCVRRDGFVFCGWTAEINGEQKQFNDNKKVTIEADTDFYAVWKEAGSVTSEEGLPCGNNAFWTIDYTSNTLTITGTGPIDGDNRNNGRWSELSAAGCIQHVIINEGITSIGPYSFCGLGMMDVSLPEGLTQISWNAFENCSSLTSVIIPQSVEYLGSSAFKDCSSLADVTVSEEFSNLYVNVFSGTPWLDSFCTGDFLILNGKLLSYKGTSEEITIPSGVTEIEKEAFCYCETLKKVTIPEGVTKIGDRAFKGGVTIDLPVSVTYLGVNAFGGYFDSYSIKHGDYTVNYGGTKEQWYAIAKGCFKRWGVYERVYYEEYFYENIHCADGTIHAMGKCGYDLTWEMDTEGNLEISGEGEMYEQYVYSSDHDDWYGCAAPWLCISPSAIKTVTFTEGVTSVGPFAFCGCDQLTQVTAAGTVSYVGSAAFWGCSSLAEAEFEAALTIADDSFGFCSSLTETPVIQATAAYYCQECFRNCTSLRKVNLSAKLDTIPPMMFYGCTSLSEVTIPSSVESIGDEAFYNCTSLENVEIQSRETAVIRSSFGNTPWLQAKGDWWIEGDRLVLYLGNDQAVSIPDTVKTLGKKAFSYVDRLTSVTIPASVEEIEDNNFYNCDGLTSVTVPANVHSLGKNCFSDCSNLESVTFVSGATTIGSGSFYYNYYPCSFVTITAPAGSKAQEYANAAGIKFAVLKKNQNFSATASASSVAVDKTVTIKVSGAQGKVTYKSSNTSLAAVDSKGVVTGKGAGTVKITVTSAETDTYYKAVKTITIKVVKGSQAITAKAAASQVAVGKTDAITVKGAKGSLTYKSSSTTIATVNAKGVVTGKKVGTVKITVTAAATANYNAASKTVTIKVVPAATTKLTAENQAKGIKLTWAKVTGASGYVIYRNNTKVKTITSGSTVTWADTAANTNGTKYVYKVVATASTGTSTLSKSLTTYRVAAPAVSALKNSAAGRMTVTWAKNAKANGYQIQYSINKAFTSGNKSVSINGASTVSKVISSLTKGKTYYVRIRTYKTVGSTKYWSSWSPAKYVKIVK